MNDWRKSSHSAETSCVEVAFVKSTRCDSTHCVEVAIGDGPGGNVLVRDSKLPDGPVLLFTQEEWDAFVRGAKDGEFDL